MIDMLVKICFLFMSQITSVLVRKPLSPPSKVEKELIAALRKTIKSLPVVESKNDSACEKIYADITNRLNWLLLHEDPRRFLRWNLIKQIMFVHAPYCYSELRYLKTRDDWASRWKSAIRENAMGSPRPFPFYPQSSGNLIHHAYHIAQFEEKTSIKISDLQFIFEFGGGYGSMCRLIHNLHYQGPYVLYDFPEFGALQRFFLQEVNIPVCSPVLVHPGVICIHEMHDLLASISNVPEKSLFIATWSISETPLALRKIIIELVSSFDFFLITYADTFGEVDNVGFFNEWRHSFCERISWVDWPIKHLPGNRYLVGAKSAALNSNRYQQELS